ncbi:hypothetical protein [Anaerovibrio lipolyticus]|uniref:hypothetical protein n=1 Tax=Anaerovibrio lipolyticus TaxID=82374 RepID=UPI0023F0DE09|nr:hypothetical protein [Anaerovibrio lipolyticus]
MGCLIQQDGEELAGSAISCMDMTLFIDEHDGVIHLFQNQGELMTFRPGFLNLIGKGGSELVDGMSQRFKFIAGL